MDSTNILWEEKGSIGYLLMNSPPGNIMTHDFFINLNEIIRKTICFSKVKGIIIYGAGRHFSSGADINQLKSNLLSDMKIEEGDRIMHVAKWYTELQKSGNFIKNLKIPVVAAMSGICYGGGLEIGLWSHIRICTNNSYFGLPEATFNLLPGWGGTKNLSDIIGLCRSLEMILKGTPIDSEEAFKIGLVHRITGKDSLLKDAERILEFIFQYKQYSKENIPEILSNVGF